MKIRAAVLAGVAGVVIAGCGGSSDPADVTCADRQDNQEQRDAINNALVSDIREATTQDIGTTEELRAMADDAVTEACQGNAADYKPYEAVKADLERSTP